jgi:hypothetical protein
LFKYILLHFEKNVIAAFLWYVWIERIINCENEFCPRLSFLFLLNSIIAQKIVTTLMTPIAEALKKEHPDKKDYWQNELKSLGIEPRRQNELNDKEELQALAESIKEVYYQDYKTAYNNNNNNNSSSCQGNDDEEEEELL